MPPPLSSPFEGHSSSIPATSKRKPVGDPSHSTPEGTVSTTGPIPVQHPAKRVKGIIVPGDQFSGRMSTKAVGKRPLIDLTKPTSAFQPHMGAKRLVIKNLRTSSRVEDLEQYYEKTRRELKDAVEAVFAGRRPQQPLERLYRGVEDICRHGDSEHLFMTLCKQCDDHLRKDVLRSIKSEGGTNVDMLRSVLKHWKLWMEYTTTIRSVFSYLDRSYLLNQKKHPQLNDMAITSFRRVTFVSKDEISPSPGSQALLGLCELVDYDRRGDGRFDQILLKESISMLHVMGIYGKSFERKFLDYSVRYFEEFGEEQSASNLKHYITASKKLLEREDYRCNAYNFDSTTKRQLMDSAHDVLINNYSEKLLDGGGVSKLLDENDIISMNALYELLRLSTIQKRLREPWESYIRDAGATIVNDTTRGDEMVVRLLEYRRALDVMIRDAFNKDDDFVHGLRQAFSGFINDKKTLSAWNTGTSKVGEMIAKHIDLLLRGGLKTLPKSLLSDTKDRAAAEQSGQSSTGDEDAELDRQLDQALELFRFIQGKDVFEAFYKQDLARRLLMGRSASADAERSMLTKLKSECGSDFTRNLEQMFKDQELAREETDSYKMWREGSGRGKASVDLTVNILSASAWPTYPDARLNLPEEVAKQIEQFEAYYVHKHTGRRLTWKHALAHCVVKGIFNKGAKDILVSGYQAVVLVLFNQVEAKDGVLSYEQIAEATGLDGPDLERTLQSLACGKTRVLTKHPKSRDVKNTDTFTVNKAFTDPKVRVKINQIQLKETKEENQETHKRIAADRQFETQAAIVRIMKSRKTMTHANLVSEVINQTKSRGAVDPSDIKKNIEKLIEKDYLEREGSSYAYLA